jgi:hypothetical protein
MEGLKWKVEKFQLFHVIVSTHTRTFTHTRTTSSITIYFDNNPFLFHQRQLVYSLFINYDTH